MFKFPWSSFLVLIVHQFTIRNAIIKYYRYILFFCFRFIYECSTRSISSFSFYQIFSSVCFYCLSSFCPHHHYSFLSVLFKIKKISKLTLSPYYRAVRKTYPRYVSSSHSNNRIDFKNTFEVTIYTIQITDSTPTFSYR